MWLSQINGLRRISAATSAICCAEYPSEMMFSPVQKTSMLDSSIDVFWTGENIISDGYSAQHIAEVAAEIRRKPFIWDNHISNDSRIRTNYLFVDPSSNR